MCYVDAVIMEVQRHVSVAPMTAAHRAKTDVMVQEFLIPQVDKNKIELTYFALNCL